MVLTPYSFAWSNSATSEDLSGIGSGSYSCTIIDANGCTTLAGPATITEPTPPTVSWSEAIDSACQTTSPIITLTAGTPVGGSWSGPGISGNTFDPLNVNLGWNVITYTDSATMCSGSAVDSIYVDLCRAIATITSAYEFTLMPNPASDYVLVNAPANSNLRVLDIAGRVIVEEKYSPGMKIDVSGLAPGVYSVIVNYGETVMTKKLVVE